MWLSDYKNKVLTLDVELTTRCNAKCPQCSRTDQNNKLNKKNWLPLDSVSISRFKKWFPIETLNHIKNIHFSGTFGDPGMCKDLFQIVKYVILKTTCDVSINTNGSMRDELFWWKLGAISDNRLHIIFDVDGTTQEMHSKYRRGTNLKKILNNMKAVSETNTKVSVFTVLFKHNQDHYDNIKKLAKEYGCESFDYVESSAFGDNPIYEFENEDGVPEVLVQITREDKKQNPDNIVRKVKDFRHEVYYNNIQCASVDNKNLKISHNGTVVPCCYLSNGVESYSVYKSIPHPYKNLTLNGVYGGETSPIMSDFMDNIKKFQLGNRSLVDIISDIWFETELPESWNNRSKLPFGCAKQCGKCA